MIVFELKDGDRLLIDEKHPYHVVSRFALETSRSGADVMRYAAEHLKHDLEKAERLQREERAGTPDAVFEREAIFEFLKDTVGAWLGAPQLEVIFQQMREHRLHHRKRIATMRKNGAPI